jgi:aspartyl-tRNA(Asn)/glutamyl-tRNA(Gln) amidotransferase subunit A
MEPKMPTDLCELDACDLLEGYAAKSFSPVELIQAIFERIEQVDPHTNAFNFLDQEGATVQAKASEQRWTKNEPVGALDGIPVSIKDLPNVAGWPTRSGSLTSEAVPVEKDSPVVARLREAGATLFGKTTSPEFGWKAVTDSRLTGITRNPWNLEKTPGGSSGGAAVAVAIGAGPLAIGTDGGGSVRIPASFTGTFGLKPSFGRIPLAPFSHIHTLSHLGPMSRSVRDAALVMNVVSRADPVDWYALEPTSLDFKKSLETPLSPLRVAYSPTLGYARPQTEVLAIVESAIETLRSNSIDVDVVETLFDDPKETIRTIWIAGMASATRHFRDQELSLLDTGLLPLILEARKMSALTYTQALADRVLLGQRMRAFNQSYDLLLTPAVAVAPFAAGRLSPPTYPQDDWFSWTPYSYPFNLTQQPAASLPVGFTPDGLPVGLQVVGPMFRDDLVLRFCHEIEQYFECFRRHPRWDASRLALSLARTSGES